MKPKLWAHQQKCVDLADRLNDLALFLEQGTGKTGTMCTIIEREWERSGPKMTLILCPKIVVPQWRRELLRFTEIEDRDIRCLTGSGERVVKVMQEVVEHKAPVVLIINYEKILGKNVFAKLLAAHPKIIVCDESHLLKSISTKRSKLVEHLADRADRRFILTGTPILNSAVDIFQQFRILDKGETFGQNFYAFRGRYFYDANASWAHMKNHYPSWQPREKTYEELNALIYRKAVRMTKDQCLDLPPLIRQTVEVELSKEQRSVYDQMKRDLVAYIKMKSGADRATVARTAVTKALRLAQITTGHVVDDEGRTVKLDAGPRITALRDLLETITTHSKVIVWASFIDNYRAIADLCAELKLQWVEIHGGISDKAREEAKRMFADQPECKVMIANQRAGGTGLDGLQVASYAIYFSKNFSLADDIQSMSRNHRGGSEIHSKVTRIDILASGTIDELITRSLENKEDIAEKILDIADEDI